jgi:acyl-CoA synthetase (AMP-forming)/AMP-acid ligase II
MSPEVISRWAKHVQLLNAYGPSEAAVVATINANVLDRASSCIGYGISSTLTWVIDPNNHDRLCPLGAIGELALEGPTLARCYLNDTQKTAAAFITNPKWMMDFSGAMPVPRKIYKTGDLVKYNADGSLDYIGRKDNQVKLHGQRMDLGEVEHRLKMDPSIRHVIVLIPKSGLLQQRLVAMLSLNNISAPGNVLSSDACKIIRDEQQLRRGQSDLINIRNRLEAQLPPYMLPQAWALVESIPILVSGKLDRNKVKGWVESADDDTYEQIMGSGTSEEQISQATKTTAVLQDIWASVLNLPPAKVNLNRSFISLGTSRNSWGLSVYLTKFRW